MGILKYLFGLSGKSNNSENSTDVYKSRPSCMICNSKVFLSSTDQNNSNDKASSSNPWAYECRQCKSIICLACTKNSSCSKCGGEIYDSIMSINPKWKNVIMSKTAEKKLAHSEAKQWWKTQDRNEAACDICNSALRRSDGYLILIGTFPGTGAEGYSCELKKGSRPDLLCETCFDKRHSNCYGKISTF